MNNHERATSIDLIRYQRVPNQRYVLPMILLPVNNIIDTDGNTHPNVTWKDTTLSGSPFVIKQICRAEMHTVTQ